MKNIKTTYFNPNTQETSIVIHLDNPFIDSSTFCNMDYSGDKTNEIEYSSENTEEKVNCAECIAYIQYAKSIHNKNLNFNNQISLQDVY